MAKETTRKRVYMGKTDNGVFEIGTQKNRWRPREGFYVPNLICVLNKMQVLNLTGIKDKDWPSGEVRRVTVVTDAK